MQLKKIISLSLICCGFLMVTGCSTPGNSSTDDEAAISDAADNDNGVQTSGIEQGDNFGDTGSSKGNLSQRTYYFDFDKSDVRQSDIPAIQANAGYLAAHPNKKVIIEGHTDPRGSREYNVALGERRANAVSTMLKSNGVRSGQVREVSYGAQRLASPGRTESDFQQDRRAKIVYQN